MPILRRYQVNELVSLLDPKVQAAAIGVGPGFPVVIANGRTRLDGGFTNITSYTSATFHVRWRTVGSYQVSDIRAVYGNFVNTASGEFHGVNAISVKAAILVGSTAHPVLFNGSRVASLAPAAIIASDPICITLPASSQIWVRTFVDANSGYQFPLGFNMSAVNSEARIFSVDGVDSGAFTASAAACYGPLALVGTINESMPGIGLIGDSLFSGTSDPAMDADGNVGYGARGIGNKFGFVLMSRASSRIQDFVNSSSHLRMGVFHHGVSHIISNMGQNDFSTVTEVSSFQALLRNFWNIIAARGYHLFACTYTPVTTSTDSFATVENQAPTSTASLRVAINDWIRTVPLPLDGFFEIADLVESGRNSKLWKAGYTTDGTHCNTISYPIAALGIDLGKLRFGS